MSLKRWINPKEFREEFGISENVQSTLRKEKRIPFSKIGGFVFYDRTIIDKWLENNCMNDMGLYRE
ncbi:MAG: helix-turn-helix domain-containing protein [Sulfurospirillum sp.]|jgi:hypothetical protein